MIKHKLICTIFLFASLSTYLQAQEAKKDSASSASNRILTFSGLLQTRYTLSLNNHVDVGGKNIDSGSYVNNSFSLRRVRLQANAKINTHFDASLLVNFAEFSSSSVNNKVLENAFIRYTLNRHFHVIAGQYRPFFGIEDLIPADLIQSLDYSNQYNAFGSNGWQSFQLGMCIYGDLNKENKMPVRYYVGIHNGNNRNQQTDNDNNKHIYARFEINPSRKTTLGINAGSGSIDNKNGYAWGGDFSTDLPLSNRLTLKLSGEYKDGTNFSAYKSCGGINPPGQFKMKGFYVLPTLKYRCLSKEISSLQVSSRYEYFDENYKQPVNDPRQTITPMVAMEFADNFSALLQAGVYIDIYKTNIPLTTMYSHNTAIVQLQVRF